MVKLLIALCVALIGWWMIALAEPKDWGNAGFGIVCLIVCGALLEGTWRRK